MPAATKATPTTHTAANKTAVRRRFNMISRLRPNIQHPRIANKTLNTERTETTEKSPFLSVSILRDLCGLCG